MSVRYRVPIYFFALVAMFAQHPATAEDIDLSSGNAWLAACTSAKSEQWFCLGYIKGMMEGYTLGMVRVGVSARMPLEQLRKNRPFCVPDEANLGQVRDVFVNYLRTHPETRHEPARRLFEKAISEAFPCQK